MSSQSLYPPNQDEEDLTGLVHEFAPLVRRIAKQSYQKNPSGLDLDDLIQSGIIGLLQAKQSYQEQRGASFKTYATMKIKFSIYDGLRKHSGLTREVGQYIKKIAGAIAHIEQSDKDLRAVHIADALGVSDGQYAHMLEEINAYKTVAIEDIAEEGVFAANADENPMHQVLNGEVRAGVKDILAALPKREQMILALYYTEFLHFKEIGAILGLTEARVSQIHTQLLTKLKTRMPHLQGALDMECW